MGVTVKVPATSANMGSGYDSIGIALDLYNIITLEESDHIDISDVHGEKIPIDETNLIYQCAKRVYDICGAPLPGLKIVEDCAIPQTRGLGSSSAAQWPASWGQTPSWATRSVRRTSLTWPPPSRAIRTTPRPRSWAVSAWRFWSMARCGACVCR